MNFNSCIFVFEIDGIDAGGQNQAFKLFKQVIASADAHIGKIDF